MRPSRGIGDRPVVLLFDNTVGKGLAVSMLAIPDRSGGSIVKADHVILPVSHMSPDLLPEDSGCFIVGEEVEVEYIHISTSMIVHNDDRRSGSVSPAVPIRFDATEPRRLRGDILSGCQVHVWVFDGGEIIESQWARSLHWTKVLLRLSMGELRPNVGREILFLGLEPYYRGLICQRQAVPWTKSHGYHI